MHIKSQMYWQGAIIPKISLSLYAWVMYVLLKWKVLTWSSNYHLRPLAIWWTLNWSPQVCFLTVFVFWACNLHVIAHEQCMLLCDKSLTLIAMACFQSEISHLQWSVWHDIRNIEGPPPIDMVCEPTSSLHMTVWPWSRVKRSLFMWT